MKLFLHYYVLLLLLKDYTTCIYIDKGFGNA